MTRHDLEHIIRASADITDRYEFVIIGSQSILGAVPYPPEVFTVSMEADIYPMDAPELAEKIEGRIGEGSKFHETHGYYAQGVGPETAILPAEWLSRVHRVHRVQNENTNGRVGYCLDLVDLFLSKAAAGREKDRDLCKALLEHGYVNLAQVLPLLPTMPLDAQAQRRLRAAIQRWVRRLREAGQDIADSQCL